VLAPCCVVLLGDVAMQVSEHFTDFTDRVRLSVQPVPNGVAAFGKFAAQFVRDNDSVIVLNGSVGRVTMEIAAHSNPQSILHADGTANALEAFLQLKEHGAIRYARRIEGLITKTDSIALPDAFRSAASKTAVSVKQIDLFRFVPGGLEPRDVVVVDMTVLSAMNCLNRGAIPPNLHLLVKPGGKLVVLRPSASSRHAKDEAVFPGFVKLQGPFGDQLAKGTVGTSESDMQIVHICRETRRKHRFSVSECLVFERLDQCVGIEGGVQQSAFADSDASEPGAAPQYEQAGVLEAYEMFHFKFGDIHGIKNFPHACAEVCLAACTALGVSPRLALDCGCGPGRLGKI
jgi:hypothetical protein